MDFYKSFREDLPRINATRNLRLKENYPKLNEKEKELLLQGFHPDYRRESIRKLRLGENIGEETPEELANLIEAYSIIDPKVIDMSKINYDVDVLVVGGGGAGVTAALFAKENGVKDVMLATKLRVGDSNTIMAEGGIAAATEPDDSPALHYLDTMGGGRYKNNPELVELLVTNAPPTLRWLENLGVLFDRNLDGSIYTHAPGGHSRKRSHSCKDLTGLEIMRVLRDELFNKQLPVLEFSAAVELLTDGENGCSGVILKNLDTNEFVIIRAKAVILATGGMGRLHISHFPTSNHYGATADGLVMAYRAGASFVDINAIQYHPTGIAWPEQLLGQLITEAMRAHGAQLVNRNGDIFINELETRDACTSAIIRECTDRDKGVITPTGTNGVWLDTPIIDLIHGKGRMSNHFAGLYNRFLEYNIDISTDPILVYPTQHYQNGGIKISQHGNVENIEGLFVAGELAGGIHGRNRLGANSLVEIFVFGRRAGIEVADYIKRNSSIKRISLDHIELYHQKLHEIGISETLQSPMLIPNYLGGAKV